MKFLMTLVLFFFALNISAQNAFNEEDAKMIIDTFFDGFHKGDTLIMNTVLAPKVTLQSASKKKEGLDTLEESNFGNFKKSIALRPSNQVWKEVLLDYKVSIDGNLAHVWTPYEFYFNDQFSHCGANAFTLAKLPEGWKIVHLIDSRRKEGCKPLKEQ